MANLDERLIIVGGGLAGCEAAWQAARREIPVDLYEMKPRRYSPAHKSEDLAELVCSNSFKSESLQRATGVLKAELTLADSLIMDAALKHRVPAGEALAVNRNDFAADITTRIRALPQLKIIRQEVSSLPPSGPVIVATGPLTSPALAESLAEKSGCEYMYFYDAISPIIEADSIDLNVVFLASRHDRGQPAYLNCPCTKEEYESLVKEMVAGKTVPLREFEKPRFFAGCLPIEEMAARGPDTLAHGPLKPVGLVDPRSGKPPYAVVQLRPEDKQGRMYNMVGFQTRLTYPEQERIFRMIPGLKNAQFLRLGSVHRNTFLNAPRLLGPGLKLKADGRIRAAGQLSGVEGYLESTAAGLWAGMAAAADQKGVQIPEPPPTSAIGALMRYLQDADPDHFQPMAANFGIFPPPPQKLRRGARLDFYAQRAIADFTAWINEINRILPPADIR